MEIVNLGKTNSIFNQYIAEIRDENIQKDSMRFRRNCERMGEIFAYEISKRLDYVDQEITTPLGNSNINLLFEQPVLTTILRAGLPVHQGFLNYFDKAENAFVSAYRKHHKDGSFDIELEYLASPDLNDKTIILSDPMLASGSSIVVTYKALLEKGNPKKIHIAILIASRQGLEYVKRFLPENTTIWVGAIDEELTAQSYIVPGLGDAGDLAYGPKE
ncbi:uracil phosphoribosyltransferase [Vicingus serpentipes]|uniref:Uracil phosphoribosyltransferase n=1 Tax=Vicingus serpentipes TaxID=1926625 RepID=A0A5C6RU78_9FLAO|nr:uracil phosphoribosyltransferase [Vicingus serpentipes]TXB65210.1 uracil phosphoribosyltransferase [Vicingus serpentipes]